MAILPICKWGNPILKKQAVEVTEITPEITTLVSNMFATMQSRNGVGLAANQIGVAKKIFVAAIPNEIGPPSKYTFINPVIKFENKKKESESEGCLSFPGIYGKIERSIEIEINGMNLSGQKIKLSAKGFLARVFQHELDHLTGTVFIEKMGPVERLMLQRKLNQLAKETKATLGK